MTTKVLIVNHGPDSVDVHLSDGSNDPSVLTLSPQTSHEFYVHSKQHLYVYEKQKKTVKTPAPAPTAPTSTPETETPVGKPFASSDFS